MDIVSMKFSASRQSRHAERGRLKREANSFDTNHTRDFPQITNIIVIN